MLAFVFLPSTVMAANIAIYDATTSQLQIPELTVGNTVYGITLSLSNTNPIEFSLDTTRIIEFAAGFIPGEDSSIYFSATGVLSIPVVQVGSDYYQVDMTLVNPGTLSFGQLVVVALPDYVKNNVMIWNDNLIIVELGEDKLLPENLFDLEGKTLRFTPEGQRFRVQTVPFQWESDFGSALSAPRNDSAESDSVEVSLTNVT